MRRILVLVSVFALMIVAVPVASAAPPGISITGGGISENNGLTGTGEPVTLRTVGFNAHKSVDGIVKGQVQIRNLSYTGTVLSQIHGTVVCIEETSGVAGGWEIRYQVTNSKGSLPFLPMVTDPPEYSSLFVHDDGDRVDEFFNYFKRTEPTCGHYTTTDIEWDSLLKGDIKVRL